MTLPTDLPTIYPTRPDLAAMALFALALDARASGNEKLLRAVQYRLALLGWSVRPLDRPGGRVD